MNAKKTMKPPATETSAGKKADAKVEEEQQQKPGEDLESQIRAAEEEAKNHFDKLLRVMAEFENFKKRMEREKSEHQQYSNEKVLTDMLPVLDDFDRVLEHIPKDHSEDVDNLAHGMELVRKNMLTALGKHGLHEVEAIGAPFDPNVHEAVSTAAAEDADSNTVIEVHRKGYTLGDRLLRPAMVTVSR
jgi:molecular chaperone GrpE